MLYYDRLFASCNRRKYQVSGGIRPAGREKERVEEVASKWANKNVVTS